jgi:hypothetical protein
MFAIAPLLTKPFTWLSHAIFGTPTATKEAEKKANEATNNTANNNSPFVNNSNQAAPTVNQNAAPAPTQTAANSNPQQPVRTYIPSPEPAVFQTQQNSNVTNVLSKSDSVMNYANNVLQNKH